MPTKAMLEKENAVLKHHIAELERQLAGKPQIDGLAEQALAEANAKLEKLFEVLPVGISVIDQHGQLVKENPMLEKILGLSADGLMRGDYRKRQYIHPDGTPFLPEEFPSARALYGEPMVEDVEIGVIKEDDQKFWMRVSAATVPFSDWKAVIVTRDITDRMKAEEALRESEQKFSTSFKFGPLAMGIVRMDNNRYVDVNESMLGLLGYLRTEILEKTYQDIGMWVDQQERQHFFEQLAVENHVSNFETTVRHKSGALINVLVSAQVVEINQEKCLVVQIIDTTERKRADHALDASEKRFSRVFQGNPAVQLINRVDNGRILDVNEACCRLVGYDREKLIGRNAAELNFWSDPEVRQQEIQQIRQAGGLGPFEINVLHTSGENRTLVVSSEPIEFSGMKALITTAIDITERKHAERLLQEREHFISSVLDLTPANIYVYDMETQSNVFSMNGVTRLLGYSTDEIRSMESELFANLVHPDDLADLEAFQSRILILSDGDIIEYEQRAKHRDGSWHVLHTYESPFLRGADGAVKQKIGVAIDVTAQRQLQSELEQSHKQLQVLSRKLIEAQEQERRAVGRELHDEIGQSLTGLRILLQMAQRQPLQDHQDKIEQAQQVAGELIDRVSAISLNLRPPMLDDMGLLPTLLWFMGRYTSQTNVRVNFIHFNLQGKRFASVIETAVYRFVQEALTNVARYAGVAEVMVRVDAQIPFVTVFIEDQGRGFDVQSVFERNNTGGLSGLRERIHLLGGDLDINSAPEQGTYISIRLPFGQKE